MLLSFAVFPSDLYQGKHYFTPLPFLGGGVGCLVSVDIARFPEGISIVLSPSGRWNFFLFYHISFSVFVGIIIIFSHSLLDLTLHSGNTSNV